MVKEDASEHIYWDILLLKGMCVKKDILEVENFQRKNIDI